MEKIKSFVSEAGSSFGNNNTSASSNNSEDGFGSGFMDDIHHIFSLSKKNRLIGFGACLGLGILLLFISTTLFAMPTKFAFTYTVANIFLVGSTVFLIGPVKQLKLMFDPVRLCATIAYLLSLFLALYTAIKLKNFILTIIAIVIEALSIAWYALSYIPFARAMVKSALSTCFPRVF